MHSAIHGRLGAQVALLQSPILPIARRTSGKEPKMQCRKNKNCYPCAREKLLPMYRNFHGSPRQASPERRPWVTRSQFHPLSSAAEERAKGRGGSTRKLLTVSAAPRRHPRSCQPPSTCASSRLRVIKPSFSLRAPSRAQSKNPSGGDLMVVCSADMGDKISRGHGLQLNHALERNVCHE